MYLPRQAIPVVCPKQNDLLGICSNECDSDSGCDNGEICCSNGCGRTCMVGTQGNSLCLSLLRQGENQRLPVNFRPSCDDDGDFTEVQCHNASCWCVDIISGQPVSKGVVGERPVCGRCQTPAGVDVSVGEFFSTEDGCNTWQVLICLIVIISGNRA